MNDETVELFTLLKKMFGSHVKAAKGLGISPRHYRRMRNSGKLMPRMKVYLETKVREIKEAGV